MKLPFLLVIAAVVVGSQARDCSCGYPDPVVSIPLPSDFQESEPPAALKRPLVLAMYSAPRHVHLRVEAYMPDREGETMAKMEQRVLLGYQWEVTSGSSWCAIVPPGTADNASHREHAMGFASDGTAIEAVTKSVTYEHLRYVLLVYLQGPGLELDRLRPALNAAVEKMALVAPK
ncbi:MAG: hypothetical protein RLZZ324_676 [Candidatus Parcubacteria bacterium]